MCSPATCRQCSKVTWSGCGMHVDSVMSGVPADRRCTCSSASSSKPSAPARRGFFRR